MSHLQSPIQECTTVTLQRANGPDAPSELFRRQCFVSVEPEEELAKHVVAEPGDDNLVLWTDWPHNDSRYPPYQL